MLALESGFAGLAGKLTLKLEYLQRTGSFKSRGAFSLLCARQIPPAGVAAASGGNFGLAVAHAAHTLAVPAAIFVPASSPPAKLSRLEAYGADVHVVDGYYAEALEASRAWVERSGALFAHAYDQREVVAGQGTCGRELEGQMPDVDTVVIAVGGGGLIGGAASWFRGAARIVAVETPTTAALHAALEAGQPVDVEVGGLAASALGAKRIGHYGFAAARRWVDGALLVSDDDLVAAQQCLWEHARIAAEPAAVAPLAALLSGAYVPDNDERVALIICGANVDPATLSTTGGTG